MNTILVRLVPKTYGLDNKIETIKQFRQILGLHLKASKDLVEHGFDRGGWKLCVNETQFARMVIALQFKDDPTAGITNAKPAENNQYQDMSTLMEF